MNFYYAVAAPFSNCDETTYSVPNTTKIHVIVDALGNLLTLSLTGGQVYDITQAETLWGLIEPGA